MPTRAPKGCPRCLQVYTGRRCPTCLQRRMNLANLRAEAAAAGPAPNPWASSQRWRELSREILRARPWCECARCLQLPEYRRDRAQVVDHADGLGLDGPRAFDVGNLVPMSRRHHGRKTATVDGGFGRPVNRPAAVDLDVPPL